MPGKEQQLPTIPWPLRIIDFEASSLEDGGYPIEVGVAVWPALEEPIQVWSALIRPTQDWTDFGHWSELSQDVHGIDRAELATAEPPMVVARTLNTLIGRGPVWCDSGPFDAYWMDALFEAAGIKPSFTLRSWDGLLRELGDEVSEGIRDQLEHAEVRHRAGEDAAMLMDALAAGLRCGC
ncbi:MAG: hypothetical protein B7Y12_03285 [Rhizobiales bacterium 24-66-13]|jgi:hypothetical protein|uniref:3'-5' exonuclease n=1 Tax=Roseixanthobacter finlandensis TaxID=3119922 RepID=UPI000BDA3983|nr:MAG: hypothetical protein B7Y61_05720 [Rhizobiales bacterium 35-66-30]OYZ82490.1 MAG: hypothetical protein B7Y12_03285 [Rhizobiales bacterium 24-66-13]OZB11258.1 MAG: hypothetical protein B7X67_04550 [Rhizobiales bacterium 39-66-18]HQS49032.1 hypothetical protein [Xanthobacteraceae bacterium]